MRVVDDVGDLLLRLVALRRRLGQRAYRRAVSAAREAVAGIEAVERTRTSRLSPKRGARIIPFPVRPHPESNRGA